ELFHEFFKWFKKKERIVLVIDEFPYLIALNSGVISIFQRIWDLNLSRQNVMLLLCGSSIGMMETEVLGYRSPLYGRRTGQWRLGKLGFEYLRRFFPGYSMEDIIRVYGCLDSIPEYLLKFSPELDFWENLRRNFVSKGSFLYEEAEILLREEFREPRNYTLILRAIAEGSRKLAQIASATGIDKGALSRYIHNLQRVGIVDAELPATFPKKSKRSLYKLTDNYFKFYFRFVLPNKNNIEAEIDITPRIKKEYDAYLGIIFEELVRELIKMRKISIGFSPEEVSPWWHKGEEIDIVTLNESTKEIAFIECKWSSVGKKDAERIFDDLTRKAVLVKWHNNKRREYYGIIAKNIANKEEFRSEGYLAYDLRDFR
ncbi:MAG: ATP-binding protein, partial [Candidatus Hydrothermarchaeota archaeon]|nr:ATP-binding protein [Candidatus Hydrothermarchaeota archaeon]